MSPGIPPSPDRMERQFTLIAGTILIVGLFFMAMYFTVFHRGDAVDDAFVGDGAEHGQLKAYLAEEERASAYEALRDFMDQKKTEPDIIAVFCRDSSHRWVGDTIEFQGDVDFERPGGRLQRHRYVATLRGSEENGWEVLELEVTPAEQ